MEIKEIITELDYMLGMLEDLDITLAGVRAAAVKVKLQLELDALTMHLMGCKIDENM